MQVEVQHAHCYHLPRVRSRRSPRIAAPPLRPPAASLTSPALHSLGVRPRTIVIVNEMPTRASGGRNMGSEEGQKNGSGFGNIVLDRRIDVG